MNERGKLAGTSTTRSVCRARMDKQPAKNPAQKPVQPCNCHPSQKKMNCGTRRLDVVKGRSQRVGYCLTVR